MVGPILIVDDDLTFCSVFARYVEQWWPTEVAHSAREALAWVGKATGLAGLVIDLRLGDERGTVLFRPFRERNGSLPMLAYATLLDDPAFVREAAVCGAEVLTKDSPVISFLRGVALCQRLGDFPALHFLRRIADSRELSVRECEVLALAVRGRSYAEIGSELGLAPGTVRTYVTRVREACGEAPGEMRRRFREKLKLQ